MIKITIWLLCMVVSVASRAADVELTIDAYEKTTEVLFVRVINKTGEDRYLPSIPAAKNFPAEPALVYDVSAFDGFSIKLVSKRYQELQSFGAFYVDPGIKIPRRSAIELTVSLGELVDLEANLDSAESHDWKKKINLSRRFNVRCGYDGPDKKPVMWSELYTFDPTREMKHGERIKPIENKRQESGSK
jgi:hypothetical protein